MNYIVNVVSGKTGAVPVDEVISGGMRSCCEPLEVNKAFACDWSMHTGWGYWAPWARRFAFVR